MKKMIVVLAALYMQNAGALVNWVAQTDPALNDITVASNWPVAFATDKQVQFNVALNPSAPELWMSQDMTFDRMVFGGGANIVFNLGAGRTLWNGGTGSDNKINNSSTFVTIKSGCFMQTNNPLTIGQNVGNTNCTLVVDGPTSKYLNSTRTIAIGGGAGTTNCGLGVYNGAVVDGNFGVGNNATSYGNWLEASGSGTLLIATNGAFSVGSATGSSGNRFRISDHAETQMRTGYFYVGANAGCNSNRADLLSGSVVTGQTETRIGSSGGGNVLNVENSTLKMSSLFTLGYYAGGNSARFTNSVFESGGIYLARDGVSTGGTNTFEFYGGVLTNTTGGIHIGIYGNQNIGIISNAIITAGGALSVGENGSDNVLKIYSATTRVVGINLGSAVATANRNYMLLSGSIITNTSGIGNAGAENVLEIANDSRVWSVGSVGGTAAGQSNVFKVLSGSIFTATGAFNFGNVSAFNRMIVDNSSFVASNLTFCIGYAAGTANSNTVSVINGGYLYATRLRVGDQGAYNNLIISNGTAYAGSDSCTIPFRTDGFSTNNGVVFSGTNAVLKSEGDILVRFGTTLEFNIPKGGYVEPPMQQIVGSGRTIGLDPTTLIKLDISGFALGGGGKQVLARTLGTFNISQTTLDSLNAQIAAQNSSLAIVGKDLVLRTPYTGGTMLKLF